MIARLHLVLHHLLIDATVHDSWRSSAHLAVQGLRTSLVALVELEGWLEEHRQQVDQVLRTVQTGDLSLLLLVLLLFLSALVDDLFVSDEPHLFWVAVLNVESILRLEEYIPCEVFSHLALVLFFKVDECLLSSRDDLDVRHFSLTSALEIDLELIFSCARREILHEEAEEHD